jgi:hypothetical protein
VQWSPEGGFEFADRNRVRPVAESYSYAAIVTVGTTGTRRFGTCVLALVLRQ